ncbi:hypothetical protein K474DRAFT_1251098 [Panus rudis PR-1116 ss-1]|nr:hypothetical protein K474DRAFT_1251098 [Panus rudis PR-1116 ss-1]
MDGAEWATSLMGGLPYWNPMMFVNLSGTCATTKLLQCRELGVYECEVSRKFEQDPHQVRDLDCLDFLARKKVVDQVAKWVGNTRDPLKQWLPILYDWEVVKGSAKRVRDRGHLIFTDMTTTRFLLVMCFGQSRSTCGSNISFEEDYATMTKANADRFMSLLKYLYHDEGKPNFVRATYTTLDKGLHPDFLGTNFDAPIKPGAPIFHVTAENFVPSLLPGEIERIDSMMSRGSNKAPPPAVKQQVMGKKEDRPAVNNYMWANDKHPVACGGCAEIGGKGMPTCSRCKLVRYCNKECQLKAWPVHKLVCKKPANGN